jgi:hypothetical protein
VDEICRFNHQNIPAVNTSTANFFPRYYEYFIIKRRKTNRIGHVWRKSSLRKRAVEGKIEGRVEVTGRQGKRRKQLLFYLKESIEYWKLNEKALDGTLWRTRLGGRITSIPQCLWNLGARDTVLSLTCNDLS